MTTDYNPVRIEEAIRECANQIAEGVKVCGERYKAYLDADREYDVAFALAYVDADGMPQQQRKYHAELRTESKRAARDDADAAYRYADRRARALEAELRALQSVNKSVVSAYNVAGRGE
ncbi:hypothetical protein OG874_00145 [Nocardia sp. NBC_00565]|uniref:hypothetical protein n=1 Tax=Nocardia sp. NBC_00565 TaxID=2975993 RepID=UPI002E8041FA|nr:hypothetical protein [Nocardia sp. NBC_00565]WUC03664.1 hypothetical protein OG874_00145 [Nocardia sp. NBC_00565]